MKVLDSVGWIEYFIEGPLSDEYGAYVENPDGIITPTIVLYEVVKKILRDGDERTAVEAAAHMRNSAVVPLDDALAMASAQVSLARKLPMADAIVYATAQASDAVLVTSDQHFKGIPGVEFIERPSSSG